MIWGTFVNSTLWALWQPGQVIILGWKNKAPSNLKQKLTFYLSFLTKPFLQFPSILADVKYVILIGGLHIEDWAHFICGSGWGVGDVWGWCVHLWQSYINAGWPPYQVHSVWSSSFIGGPLSPSARIIPIVIQIYLKNGVTSSGGRDVCVSTVHLLSRWKLSFVVCALSERWWFRAQCLGWIVSPVFSVWQYHFF